MLSSISANFGTPMAGQNCIIEESEASEGADSEHLMRGGGPSLELPQFRFPQPPQQLLDLARTRFMGRNPTELLPPPQGPIPEPTGPAPPELLPTGPQPTALTVTEAVDGRDEWWESWERFLRIRRGQNPKGCYTFQDLTALNGSVVRLWDDAALHAGDT
ncbi:hypothetical protein Fmac_013260 [Flemingia macrophylla]|uniref:Uncharacterized protein n=1 Tax=Flemingia macrophylla TaxID=520843 RepID=A0ABD1MSQ3_9FABA